MMKRAWGLIVLLVFLAACNSLPEQQSQLDTLSGTALLPNIEALPADNLYLEKHDDGKILLRFNTTTWNKGTGPLELIGDPLNGGAVSQIVYYDDGTTVAYSVGSFVLDDGHNHFHYDDYAIYKLQKDVTDLNAVASGAKTSFCIMDTDRINHRLPGAPKTAQYTSCGKDTQGMSVGWGDTYKAGLEGQWIEVTKVQSGRYKLIIHVNPKGDDDTADGEGLIESDFADNTSVVTIDLTIDPSATNGGTVTIIDDTSNDSGGGPGNGNCPRC